MERADIGLARIKATFSELESYRLGLLVLRRYQALTHTRGGTPYAPENTSPGNTHEYPRRGVLGNSEEIRA
jgi:hypothetical protein